MATKATIDSTEALSDAAAIGKALGDPHRLRALAVLRGRELCVCHLVELFELDASTVSRHVGVLRRSGLVAVRKEGRWLHLSRRNADAAIWTVVDELLSKAPEVEIDADRIHQICSSEECR